MKKKKNTLKMREELIVFLCLIFVLTGMTIGLPIIRNL